MFYLSESANWNKLFNTVKEFSLVPELAACFYVNAALSTVKQNLNGVFVECGCWFGGVSLAVCIAQREFFGKIIKPIYLFDKFLGFDEPCDKDGHYFLFLKEGIKTNSDYNKFSESTKSFFENAINKSKELSAQAVKNLFRQHGFISEQDFFIVEGWVKDTVPAYYSVLKEKEIALLRLDVDLYEATKKCFELESLVTNNGLVLIDDYYHFDGCATAVHEYLAMPENTYKLRPIPGQGVFYEKRKLSSFEFVPEWIYTN